MGCGASRVFGLKHAASSCQTREARLCVQARKDVSLANNGEHPPLPPDGEGDREDTGRQEEAMRVAAAGGSRRRGRDEDLSNATTEEILDVQLKAHGGGGRGGGRRRRRRGRQTALCIRYPRPHPGQHIQEPVVPRLAPDDRGHPEHVGQGGGPLWAGRFLGFHAVAGLAVAQLYTNLVMTGRMGLDTGMQAMIARAIGANRPHWRNHVALLKPSPSPAILHSDGNRRLPVHRLPSGDNGGQPGRR